MAGTKDNVNCAKKPVNCINNYHELHIFFHEYICWVPNIYLLEAVNRQNIFLIVADRSCCENFECVTCPWEVPIPMDPPRKIAEEAHNQERAHYHDTKVFWSNTLADKAEKLNEGCEFKNKSTAGENLYWTSVNDVEDGEAFVDAVNDLNKIII